MRESVGAGEVFPSKNPVSLVGCVSPDYAEFRYDYDQYSLIFYVAIAQSCPRVHRKSKTGCPRKMGKLAIIGGKKDYNRYSLL
ncbi:hypothetical protein [Phormidium nigroviride]